ncbi:hypothetical protein EON83_19370 [bacterium]|nr:MAG: hypothetical protein EON83_19370 [bacterium]
MNRKLRLFAGISLVTTLIYGVWALRPLNVEGEFGPSPTLPSPNGYDELLKAHRQILTVSTEFERRNKQAVDPLLEIGSPEGKIYPSHVRAQWVEQSKEGFETLDRALKMPFQFPVFIPKSEYDSRVEGYHIRFLAKGLTVKSDHQASQGDHFGAAKTALDAIQLGVNMTHNSTVSDGLNGVACEAYGRRALTTRIAFLTPAQASHLAKRLESINANRPKFSHMLEREKLAHAHEIEVQIKAQLQKPTNPSEYQTAQDAPSPLTRLALPFANAITRRQIRAFDESIDEALPYADVAWASRKVTPPSAEHKENLLVVKLLGSRFFFEKSATMANQCQIRLALHAHKKTTGAYPQRLEELSPRYMGQVPTDTFAAAPMRYMVNDNRYRLWSVGPDGHDDGGRAIEDKTKTQSESRYLVRPDSTGDIVANISV